LEVSSADKYEDAFKEATKARSAALAVTESPLTVSNRKQIADLAMKNRLPAMYTRREFEMRTTLNSSMSFVIGMSARAHN